MHTPLRTNLLTSLKAIILALFLTVGISYLYAAWANPGSTPPDANVPAPINVGSVGQSKSSAIGATDLVALNSVEALGGADPYIKAPKFCIGADCRTAWPSSGSIPSGSSPGSHGIVFFTGACPSGWSEYAPADGRFVVGIVGAKTNAGMYGTTGLGNEIAPTVDLVVGPGQAGSDYGPATVFPGTYNLNVPYIQLRACQAP